MRRATPHRDPGIELFDRACDLLESTSALRRAIADPGYAEAVPAVLNCVEAALRDLAFVAGELQREHEADTARPRARAAHGYRNLHVALDDAAMAAHVAQALARRAAESD